jgi:5-methylcytosine-specific restriction enzyme A
MTRRKRTAIQRAAIFDQHEGICHLCGGKIDGAREAWELEHLVAHALNGDDSDENLRPAHVACHKAKTKEDVARIAKAKRVHAKHIGAKPRSKNPLPGSKGSGMRKRMDGSVVFIKERRG